MKNPVGPPTVITANVVRKRPVDASIEDATDSETCAFAGIRDTAYYDERNP
jgi:hypothetical protein